MGFLLYLLDLPKTIYFNLRYFGVKGLIKLPVLVSRKVKLLKSKGKFIIESEYKCGMIKIGYQKVGIFDKRYCRSIWEVSGNVIFKGKAYIGHGSKICVGKNGTLVFGNNFVITSSSSIVCFKQIAFGNECLLSWDILVIDTDFHRVRFVDGSLTIQDKEIIIGNNNWISCRVTILKGTNIIDNNVIAANSVLNKNYNCSNYLIAGNPAILKKEISGWK